MVNPGFDFGDFQNWRLNVPCGAYKTSAQSRPTGTAKVVSLCVQQRGMSQRQAAAVGNSFAALGSLEDNRFTGNRTYDITFCRTINMFAGESISGSAFLNHGEPLAQDFASEKILNEAARTIAQPWFAISH